MDMKVMKIRREVSTRIAKDRIASLVEDAKQGYRTIVRSRGVKITKIGPAADLEDDTAEQIPTTVIKTGQQSIKGIMARNAGKAGVYLTIRGEKVASMRWLPKDRGGEATADDALTTQRDERVEELISLLQETRVIQSQAEHYRKIRACALRLLEDSDEVAKRLPDNYARDQLIHKLKQLRADLSVP